MSLYQMAIVSKTRDGLWEAWVHRSPEQTINKFVTKEEAMENCLNTVKDNNYVIHWFDPTKNYKHCDTAFMAKDNNLYTFLAYRDGKALVMANTGEESLVDPWDLMPCRLNGMW